MDWTQERIAKLSSVEIKNLRRNADERGAPEVVALCDLVLGPQKTAVRTVRRKAKGQGKPLVSRKKAFETRGVKVNNPRWSWGGVRSSDGVPVLTIWQQAIERTDQGSRYLLWAPNVDGARPWSDTAGGKERLEHCRLAIEKGEGEGVLIYGQRHGNDLDLHEASKVDGADADTVIRFKVEMQGEEYWAAWGGVVPAG